MADILTVSKEILQQGKETKKVKRGKELVYLEPNVLLRPFFDYTDKLDVSYVIKVIKPNITSMTNDGLQDIERTEDIRFNRVWVQAILPESHTISNHKEVLGCILAIDKAEPILKAYRGHLNAACMNLTVFNPTWLRCFRIEPLHTPGYNIEAIMDEENNFKQCLEVLKNTVIKNNQIHEKLGSWVDAAFKENYDTGLSNIKLKPDVIVRGYNNVYLDTKSQDFVPDIDKTAFQMYNGFTRLIRDENDITDKFEQTMLLSKIMKLS